MVVDLITSWGQVDGLAEYARFLTEYAKGVEFRIHGKPFSLNDHFPGDVVHLSHEHGMMHMWDTHAARQLKAWGKKTVMTYHNSLSGGCASTFTAAWDRVVVHEKNSDGFIHIPMGIPVWENTNDVKPQNKLGWVGFPVAHKGIDWLARAAADLKVGLLAICPVSQWGDAYGTKGYIENICPGAEVVTDWLPMEKVVERLAECAVTVFLHKGYNLGISGSVRLGLATSRPIVITQNRQMHDIWDEYGDEIYLVNSPVPSYEHVRSVIEHALNEQKKRPSRILEDMNWGRCGKMYADVYEELAS